MRSVGLIGSVAALAALALSAGPASGAVRQCKTVVYANGPVYVTSTSGLTCRAAAGEQRRYTWTGKNTFTTPGGYKCKPSGRGRIGYQIRCAKLSETQAPRVYRIEFAD